ncbi:MAG: linear amide C-N hydrolase [Tissierellaceae bacterium]|nr:linear amide C-N hydrolase [Tissierellaceae bacterium]
MCTGVKIDYIDGCVMGRTMDFEAPINYNGLFFPRGYNFCSDLMGEPLHSKYMALGIGFENRDPLKDGVNEHGLIGITNTFTGFDLYSNKVEQGKINISSLYYFTYALTNYKSLEELIVDLPNIHIPTKDYKGDNTLTPDFHFMFADSTKRCIVVEPKKGKLIYYENPYDVMTNSPRFESHVRRLNKVMDPEKLEDFNSSKDLPGGYDPVSRFIKAFYLTRMNVKSKNTRDALSNIYGILNSMSMPDGFVRNKKYEYNTYTRYICAYDTKTKLMTIKSHTNPMVYQLGFEDMEGVNERRAFFIEKEFTTQKLK